MRNRNHIYMTSEGFSFHTIELKQIYRDSREHKYKKAFRHLKRISGNDEFYELKKYNSGCHFCGHFSKHGIRIYLSGNGDKSLHTIKAVINPRKLIDPDCSYLGIMQTDEKSLDKMEHRFTEIMRKAGLPEFIDEWSLTRIDLCVNFVFSRRKLPEQMIQLISLGPVPYSYTRDTYTAPSQINPLGEVSLGKHSVKLSNKSVALVAYDKVYQMKEEELPFPSKPDMEKRGILRLELQCSRAWIADQAKEHKCKTTREKLDYFSSHSQEYLCEYVDRLYLHGEYCRYDLLRSKIKAADSISKESKKRMLDFAKLLTNCSDFDAAFQILAETLTEKQLELLTNHFSALNISPVPLMDKCKLKAVESLPMILHEMDDCSFEKRFNPKKKYLFPLKSNICLK